MAEYTVKQLKQVTRLGLPQSDAESHMIAWANGMSPRHLRDMDGGEYSRMRMEYTRATLPPFFRKLPGEELGSWYVYSCDCGCMCGDCDGLEMTCGECDCGVSRLLGKIPRKLTAGHLIDAGDDPVLLTETLLGGECSAMTISDFRAVQFAVMSTLRTGEIPLSESTTTAT